MRSWKFVFAGVFFGITMSKSEAISWYRIQEMFRFQSFHMYGIIGTAVIIGVSLVYLIKKCRLRDTHGNPIIFRNKESGWKRYLAGGSIFGLGWALTGACPGPMFVILGHGYWATLIVITGALVGTYLYGLIKKWLPH